MVWYKRQAGSFGRFTSSSMKFRITSVRGTRFCGGLAEGNVQSGGGFWHGWRHGAGDSMSERGGSELHVHKSGKTVRGGSMMRMRRMKNRERTPPSKNKTTVKWFLALQHQLRSSFTRRRLRASCFRAKRTLRNLYRVYGILSHYNSLGTHKDSLLMLYQRILEFLLGGW